MIKNLLKKFPSSSLNLVMTIILLIMGLVQSKFHFQYDVGMGLVFFIFWFIFYSWFLPWIYIADSLDIMLGVGLPFLFFLFVDLLILYIRTKLLPKFKKQKPENEKINS